MGHARGRDGARALNASRRPALMYDGGTRNYPHGAGVSADHAPQRRRPQRHRLEAKPRLLESLNTRNNRPAYRTRKYLAVRPPASICGSTGKVKRKDQFPDCLGDGGWVRWRGDVLHFGVVHRRNQPGRSAMWSTSHTLASSTGSNVPLFTTRFRNCIEPELAARTLRNSAGVCLIVTARCRCNDRSILTSGRSPDSELGRRNECYGQSTPPAADA